MACLSEAGLTQELSGLSDVYAADQNSQSCDQSLCPQGTNRTTRKDPASRRTVVVVGPNAPRSGGRRRTATSGAPVAPPPVPAPGVPVLPVAPPVPAEPPLPSVPDPVRPSPVRPGPDSPRGAVHLLQRPLRRSRHPAPG